MGMYCVLISMHPWTSHIAMEFFTFAVRPLDDILRDQSYTMKRFRDDSSDEGWKMAGM